VVSGAVTAQIALDRQGKQIVPFRPVDVSARGIGIWTEEPLEFGSDVYLKTSAGSNELIRMKVRWCKENYHNTEYYRCGLEVADEHVDLTEAWKGLTLDKNANEFTETMVMALLGTVARDIAHDINNQTQAILLNIGVMRDKAAKKHPTAFTELVSYMDSIQHNAVWIGKFVNTMRSFTSPAENEQMRQINLNNVFEDVKLLSSNRFRSAQVALQIKEPKNNECIFGRHTGIVRAILNLVANAFDAVPKRDGAWVRIDTRDIGDYIVVGVENLGEPMSAEKWQRVSQAYQSSKGTSYSGLGLDITQRIMAEHHGHLNFDQRLDCCRITLTFPKMQKG